LKLAKIRRRRRRRKYYVATEKGSLFMIKNYDRYVDGTQKRTEKKLREHIE